VRIKLHSLSNNRTFRHRENAFERNYLQTRQSSGTMGNDSDEKEGSSSPDCSPRRPTPMTMATAASMTSTALPGSPGSSMVCPATDVATNLQHRRRLQEQQPQELSSTQTRAATDAASSSSTYEDKPSRTPLSGNVLLSLPASPKRSSASDFSSSKTPAISKSQMKGESNLKVRAFYYPSFLCARYYFVRAI